MNIINLQKGQEFKNLKELCNFVDIKYKDSTNSRKAIFKELKRYVEFEKKGRKITITEIYTEPKEKIDNRGKSESSRNNNNIYMQHIDPILTNYLINMDNNVMYVTINQLAEIAGIINRNYREFKDNQKAFFNYLKENKIVENSTAVNNVFYNIQDILRPMISSSLDRLKNQGIIEYEYNYILHKKLEVRLATDEEVKIIKECEERILQELEVSRAEIGRSDTLRKKYYKKVNELVFEEIKDIDLYYMGYKITVKSQAELKLDNIQQHKEELNSIVKERVEDRNIRHKKKVEDKAKELGFGSQIFREYEEDILKDSYLLDTKTIIGYLLDQNAEKIKTVQRLAPKDTIVKEVKDNSQTENINTDEVNTDDNFTETEFEVSSVFNEMGLSIQESKIESETEWAFAVSYKYIDGTGKLKDEYKPKTWKFEPKYPWQREDFIGSEYDNDELFAYSKETGKYIFL